MNFLYVLALVLFLFSGCAAVPPISQVAAVLTPSEPVDYLREVKPILDKRCVVCHSCYNSPCQLKLSSFEGLERGATQKEVYDSK